MSENPKYLKKGDLERLDKFIQDSLDKYFYVKAWDDLYKNTGKNHKKIISDKSTIPDLVIFNQGFNKLDCFYYPNMKKGKIKFPRTLFVLKPKKIKDYNPSSSNMELDSKNKEEQKEKEKEETFQFKSIPKEIENKFIGDKQLKENKLFNELKDFMKDNKDDKPKVLLVKENVKNDNEDKRKSKNNNYWGNQKNKFNNPYTNILNNYNDYYQKMFQNMQYQNFINRQMKVNNKFNNNSNISNNKMNQGTEKRLVYEDDKNINLNINNNDIESIKFYSKDGEQNKDIPDYIRKMEEFLRKNMTERIWIVFNEKTGLVRNYNNEELYYLLNIILKNGEIKHNTIDCKKFYDIADVYVAPKEIFEILERVFQKKLNE